MSNIFLEKTKNRKKRKRIVISLVLILVLLLIAGIIAGNYFYDLAIARNDKTDLLSKMSGPPSDNPVYQEAVKKKDRIVEDFEREYDAEDVYITSEDGLKLHGYKYKNDKPDAPWIISVHGYMSEGEDMKYYASKFIEMGYNVLLPDLRGHGVSEGDYSGMGWNDRLDILMWVNSLVQDDAEARIVLHGVSMGAATVMMTSGEELLSDRVVAAVEDCGYTSAVDEFSHQLKGLFSLPPFPVMQLSSLVTQVRAGYSLYDASAVKQLAKNTTPMLFIHGGEDTFVPVKMIDEVYEANAGKIKEKLIVKGATHANSATFEPDIYFEAIEEFLEPFVN